MGLGAGQGGGAPRLGPRASVSGCRTASSVAVRGASGAVILLDASPDSRAQSRMLLDSPLYPTGRESLVDGVFITHAHMGHYAGLLHFGKEAAATDRVPLFGSPRFITFMEENEPWATLLTTGSLDPIPIDAARITIDHTLAVTAITVPHRDEFSDTVAFSIEADGEPWLLYLPDIDDWQSWDDAESEIARHDIALVDATFSASGELPDRDLTSIPHPLVPDTIARFTHLTTDTHIVLTHINHSNVLGNRTATITRKATDAGFTVAFDGLTLERGRAG